MSNRAPSRRSLLKAIFGLLSAAVGVAFGVPVAIAFLDPTWRRTVEEDSGAGSYGPISDLPLDEPIKRDVIGTRRDAWDRSAPGTVGAVWLVRRSDTHVDAYSTVCPHLGCPIGFDPAKRSFTCPCHESAFGLADGRVLWGPSPRGLDSLPVEIREGGRVQVTYQRFIVGIRRKVKA
jgi:menaquinol-cytochrome c reductase iron-sulfur subunit